MISGLSAALLGLAVGVLSYTFVYAEGASYLSNDPEACANCHVMREVLQDWRAGDHHHTAVCNDCHVPQQPALKWLVKGMNGAHHSYAFTFLDTPANIRPSRISQVIVRQNCVRCHGPLLPHALTAKINAKDAFSNDTPNCLACHRQVGHWH